MVHEPALTPDLVECWSMSWRSVKRDAAWPSAPQTSQYG